MLTALYTPFQLFVIFTIFNSINAGHVTFEDFYEDPDALLIWMVLLAPLLIYWICNAIEFILAGKDKK